MAEPIKTLKPKKTTGMYSGEPFWKSRRVWAAALTLIATAAIVAFPDRYDIIVAIGTGISAALGLSSWVFPKQ